MLEKQTSDWRAQLGALGLDAEAATSSAAMAEAHLLGDVTLPPLVLPAAPKRPVGFGAGWKVGWVVGLAASIALVLFAQRQKPDRTPKGGTHVTVWWERDGVVHEWTASDQLRAGDRVIGEVRAARDGQATWYVTNGDGRTLTDAAFVERTRIDVRRDVPVRFTESLRLTGEADGEVLTIVVCPADVASTDACESKAFRLR